MNHCILGNGQVANAIKDNITKDATIRVYDKGEWEGLILLDCDVLHITIPYTDKFLSIVYDALFTFRPKEVLIIHSTVKSGTTSQIQRILPAGFNNKSGWKLYSPVNGRHDDGFAENLRKYPKYFSGDKGAYDKIIDQFLFRTEYLGNNTDELEFAKIMCTAYMYWNLIYERQIYELCEERHYDFENVYRKWNYAYNKGIADKHPEWCRPVYEHTDGLPGGHCLRPNIHLDDNFICNILRMYENLK